MRSEYQAAMDARKVLSITSCRATRVSYRPPTSPHPRWATWVPALVTPLIASGTNSFKATLKSWSRSSKCLCVCRTPCWYSGPFLFLKVCCWILAISPSEIMAAWLGSCCGGKDKNRLAAACTALSTRSSCNAPRTLRTRSPPQTSRALTIY